MCDMPKALLWLWILSCCSAAFGQEPKVDLTKVPAAFSGPIDFRKDIEPILQRACVLCHGARKQRGGLRLDDGAAALKGGNAGAVIVPGKALRSRLLHLVAGLDPDLRMPPKEKAPWAAAWSASGWPEN